MRNCLNLPPSPPQKVYYEKRRPIPITRPNNSPAGLPGEVSNSTTQEGKSTMSLKTDFQTGKAGKLIRQVEEVPVTKLGTN